MTDFCHRAYPSDPLRPGVELKGGAVQFETRENGEIERIMKYYPATDKYDL